MSKSEVKSDIGAFKAGLGAPSALVNFEKHQPQCHSISYKARSILWSKLGPKHHTRVCYLETPISRKIFILFCLYYLLGETKK